MVAPWATPLTILSDGTNRHRVTGLDYNMYEMDVFENTDQLPLSSHDIPRIGAIWSQCNFACQLAGDTGGAGSLPAKDPLLLAVGLNKAISAGVNIIYSVTGLPADLLATNTVTLSVAVGNGYKQVATTAVGDADFLLETGKPVIMNCRFKGLYTAPSDATIAHAIDTTEARPVVCKGMTLTVGGVNLTPKRVAIALNNEVLAPRYDMTGSYGVIQPVIVAQRPTIVVDCEQKDLSTFNSITRTIAETKTALNIVLGATAGNILTITCDMYPNAAPNFSDTGGILGQSLSFRMGWGTGDNKLAFKFT